jgi:AraC-like DNA-binding protein
MYDVRWPHPALRPYINNYWRLYTHNAPVQETFLVDAKADLIFNFGVDYQRRGLHDEQVRSSNLDAQRMYPLNVAQIGGIRLVGVRFAAGGLAAFARVPIGDLSGQTLAADCLWGPALHTLEAQLYDALDFAAQVVLLNSFLAARLDTPPTFNSAHAIAAQIEAGGGQVAIQHLSREVGYSIRTLDRLFSRVYGISPKQYARIVRFQTSLTALLATTRPNLAQIAATYGYYDQAHFAKDFIALAGTTPERYLAQLRHKTEAEPNLVQFLQDVR